MKFRLLPLRQQLVSYPRFDALASESVRIAQASPPERDRGVRNDHDLRTDLLEQSGTEFALHVNEREQEQNTGSVDFVQRVGPDKSGATRDPFALGSTAYP